MPSSNPGILARPGPAALNCPLRPLPFCRIHQFRHLKILAMAVLRALEETALTPTLGKRSHGGLILINNPVNEPQFYCESLLVKSADQPALLNSAGRRILELDPLKAEFDFCYDWYRPSVLAPFKHTSTPLSHDAMVLLIGGSYTSSMQ